MLYNTKTKALIELDNACIQKIKRKDINAFTKEEIDILKMNGFLIESEEEDYKDILEQLQLIEQEYLNIIFFTTFDCNFRCLYCYEKHVNEFISKDTYDCVLDRIKELKKVKHINISWFGGEPTLCSDSVLYFLNELNNYAKVRSIKVTSSMTTNFYLVNQELLVKFLDLGLRTFQVTLDGLAQLHNKYRPLIGNKETFNRINQNLLDAQKLDKKFNISIRLNFDKSSDYREFLSYIKNTFLIDERFNIIINEIGQWGKKLDFACNSEDIEKRHMNILQLMKELNISLESDKSRINYFSGCYACYCNSISILPNKRIMKCTVHLDDEKNIVGNIMENKLKVNDEKWTKMHFEDCPKCIAFPTCLGKLCPYRTPKTFSECSNKAYIFFEELGDLLWE